MSIISNISRAKSSLIVHHPFFATLLLGMPMREDPETATMATDGEEILFNPAWAGKLTHEETVFVLAHETLHCVFDHMGRRGSRTPNRWNQAADYIINALLTEEKIGKMPKGGLHNPALVKSGGGTAEGVYKLLPESSEKNGAGKPGGAMDQVNDAGSKNGKQPTDAAATKAASAALKVRVIQAKNAAKMQGKLSVGLERLIDDLTESRVDWRDALRKFLSERAKIEPNWSRPKRRLLSEELYLPSLGGEKMGRIIIPVDCSGSVDKALLTTFASEINSIRTDVAPSQVEVIYFDSEVLGDPQVFSPEEKLELHPRGGGGTAFSPVFDFINKRISESGEDPACVIFLTDLVCNDFGPRPYYPVIWCVPDGKLEKGFDKVPFGEILKVRGEEK